MMKYISNSEKETEKIAKTLTKSIKNGDIVWLCGDLGAGKTTFVKAFFKALGGNENLVTSPTFTLVNEYEIGKNKIYHLDLYRIESEEELYNIGIEEYLYSNNICFVEWAERANGIINFNKKLSINKLGENKREFIFEEVL